MSSSPDKLPPQAIEAEQAVLSVMLQNRQGLEIGLEMLTGSQFYLAKHCKIFRAIQSLHEAGSQIDEITLQAELTARGVYEEIGGLNYLLDLTGSTISFDNIRDHCKLIIEAAAKNRIIETCNKAINKAYDTGSESGSLLGDIEQATQELRDSCPQVNLSKASEKAPEAYRHLIDIHEGRISAGIMSQYPGLNDLLNGFRNKELIIVAGRPRMGKTAMLVNLIDHITIALNLPTLFFSVEMSAEAIYERWFSVRSSVPVFRIRSRKGSQADLDRIKDYLKEIERAPLYIDDTAALDITELRGRAKSLVKRYGIKIIFVDYLQRVGGEDKKAEEHVQVGQVAEGLKNLAKEQDIPVVAACQMNRNVETRGKDARPMLSDIAGSGVIDRESDVIMFPWRKMADPQDPKSRLLPETDLIIEKHRNGPSGTVKLKYNDELTRFEPVPTNDEPMAWGDSNG